MFLYTEAWSSWPHFKSWLFSLDLVVSKQVGPTEQGKAQGCITGLCSFASIISPLIFSPVTALFLSNNASFQFPGFSLVCATFAVMIAFIQSIMIQAPQAAPESKVDDSIPAKP